MRIVIIEAELANAGLLQSYLGRLPGCKTEVFDDPAVLFAFEAYQSPDLIVLDGAMPQLLSLVEKFRQLYVDVPVLISLMHFDAEFCFQALAAGATDFLRKPWDRVECYARAKSMLAQRTCQLELDKRTGWLLDEVNEAYQAMEINAAQAQEMVEIAQTNLELEEASRAKNDFLARVSHDLRAPLTTILGYSNLLTQDAFLAGRDTEFSAIRRNVHQLLALIDELLEFARGTIGAVRVKPEYVALHRFVAHLMQQADALAHESGNEAVLELVGPLPQAVEFDPMLVNRVLSNFLSNAAKFTQGGRLVLKVTGVQTGSGWMLMFEVSDTGAGIALAEQEKIFEPFYRTVSNTDGIPGSGLGLAICHQLAEAMGGGIAVQSAQGEGSCFSLRLCVPEVAAVEEAVSSAPVVRPVGGRILLVDDDPEARHYLASLLGAAGYFVACAGDGEEALTLLREVRPDIVMTDQSMPRMDGWSLLFEVRMRSALPVILLSSIGPNPPECWPERMDFDARLLKSVDPDQLVSELARVRSLSHPVPGIKVPEIEILNALRSWAEHGALSVLEDAAEQLAVSHPEYADFAGWILKRVDALDLEGVALCCARLG